MFQTSLKTSKNWNLNDFFNNKLLRSLIKFFISPPKHCSVQCCPNRFSPDATCPYFTFNIRDGHRKQEWCSAVGLTKDAYKKYICIRHFKTEDIIRWSPVPKLKQTAVPSLHLSEEYECNCNCNKYCNFNESSESREIRCQENSYVREIAHLKWQLKEQVAATIRAQQEAEKLQAQQTNDFDINNF